MTRCRRKRRSRGPRPTCSPPVTQPAALTLLDEATAAEEALPLEFGPPIIVKPSHELYGDVLLKLGRPEQARAQYEKALARAPRRSLALAGLARAAGSLGDSAALARTCAELAGIRGTADETVAPPQPCGESVVVGSISPAR